MYLDVDANAHPAHALDINERSFLAIVSTTAAVIRLYTQHACSQHHIIKMACDRLLIKTCKDAVGTKFLTHLKIKQQSL